MGNPVKSYQRRIHGKLVTVSPYSRKNATGRAGVGGPNPGQTRTAKKASSKPKSAENNYQSPDWLTASPVRNLAQFDKGPQLDAALQNITLSPQLGGIVVFPSQEILNYALQFAKSKGLHEVYGVPIEKLFVLAKDEPAARTVLYDALKKEVTKNKLLLEKKLNKKN